uniref:A disintegrin and metalloproteinase with thrombospondin motifs 18-like n=1 Tax=Crassostrea virginica TaxID=6565 RepID=A0A8B8BWC0_CRAVI|nr:A disintegrin and metalloproteinase with thrombospondin motifs 18-like [Crassostrea virginica]
MELECLYTPWATISSCTRTCGDGFKVQVRGFSLVPKGTPLAEHCDKDLSRNKTCNINACPTPREEALDQPLLLPPVVDTGPHTNVNPVDVVTGVVNAGTAALG